MDFSFLRLGRRGKSIDDKVAGTSKPEGGSSGSLKKGGEEGTPIYQETKPIPATNDTVGVDAGSDASSTIEQQRLFYLVQVKREGDIVNVLVLSHPDSDFVPGIISLPKAMYESIRNEIRPESCGKDKTWIRVAGKYAERFYPSVRAYSPEALNAEVPDWRQNLRPWSPVSVNGEKAKE